MGIVKRRHECGERLLDMRNSLTIVDHYNPEFEYQSAIELHDIISIYPTKIDENKISKISGVPQSIVHLIMDIKGEIKFGVNTHRINISDILKIINGLLSDLMYEEPSDLPGALHNLSDKNNLHDLAKSVSSNNQVIRMISAELVKQIDDFVEALRKKNDIEPALRDDLSEFLVTHRRNLISLALSVPQNDDPEIKDVEKTATYLARYFAHIKTFTSEQTSPENLAKITLPTGIVLLSGAVGAAFGQPLIGFGFGAWLTGKLSPDKLAARVLEDSAKPEK